MVPVGSAPRTPPPLRQQSDPGGSQVCSYCSSVSGGQIRPRRWNVCLAELVRPCGGRGEGPSRAPSLDPHKLAAELGAERWPRARGTAAAEAPASPGQPGSAPLASVLSTGHDALDPSPDLRVAPSGRRPPALAVSDRKEAARVPWEGSLLAREAGGDSNCPLPSQLFGTPCGWEEVAASHVGRFLLKFPLMRVPATAWLSISWALASSSQPMGCLKFTPM